MRNQTIKTEVASVEVAMNLFSQTPVPEYHQGLGAWAEGRGSARVLPVRAEITFYLDGHREPSVRVFGKAVNKDGTDDRRFTTHVSLVGHYEMQTAIIEQAQKFLIEPVGQVEVKEGV